MMRAIKRFFRAVYRWLSGDYAVALEGAAELVGSAAEPKPEVEHEDQPATHSEFDDLESDVAIVRINAPGQLLAQPIFELITQALATNPLCDLRKAVIELAAAVHQPSLGLLCAYEHGEWVGMVLAQRGYGLVDGVSVLHFYNRGSRTARLELSIALEKYAKSMGTNRIIGFDLNDNPERLWRTFPRANLVRQYGPMMEFDVGNPRSEQ